MPATACLLERCPPMLLQPCNLQLLLIGRSLGVIRNQPEDNARPASAARLRVRLQPRGQPLVHERCERLSRQWATAPATSTRPPLFCTRLCVLLLGTRSVRGIEGWFYVSALRLRGQNLVRNTAKSPRNGTCLTSSLNRQGRYEAAQRCLELNIASRVQGVPRHLVRGRVKVRVRALAQGSETRPLWPASADQAADWPRRSGA